MTIFNRMLLPSIILNLFGIAALGQDEAFEFKASNSNKATLILDVTPASALEDPFFGSIVSAITMTSPPDEFLKFEEIQKIRRLTLFVGGQSQPYMPPEFVMRIRVNDKKLLPKFGNMINPWTEMEFVEEDGWMVHYDFDGENMVMRYKEDLFEFGSLYFCNTPPRTLVTAEAYKQFSSLDKKSIVRAVVDADAFRRNLRKSLGDEFQSEWFVDQVLDGEFLNGFAFWKYSIKMLGDLKTLNFSAKANSEQLLKLEIIPKEDKARTVEANAVVLMDLIRFHLDFPTKFLKQNNSPIGDLLDSIDKSLKFKATPKSIELVLNKPKDIVTIVAKLIAGPKMKGSDRRLMERLTKTASAVKDYHDANRKLPFSHPSLSWEDDPVGSGLSWRVRLLPMLGLKDDYDKMELSKDWTAQGNQSVINEAKKHFTFRDGSMICGIIADKPAVTLENVTDDASNKVMLIVNPQVEMEPWTKPFDLTIDDAVQLVMNLKENEHLWIAMYDGSVAKIGSPTISGATKDEIRSFMDPLDGMKIRNQLKVPARPQLFPPVPEPNLGMEEDEDIEDDDNIRRALLKKPD